MKNSYLAVSKIAAAEICVTARIALDQAQITTRAALQMKLPLNRA